MLRRRTLLLGGAAASGAGAIAAPHVAVAQRSRVLKFVPQSDLGVLDPIWTAAYVTRNHGMMVFDTLYGTDAQFRASPQMAAGHQVDEDGKRWTISLRDGLRFHDGTPVLARDCVASIRRWGARDGFGQALLAATDELAAADDRTIRFRLSRPFPLLPDALGRAGVNICAIMPERLASTDPFQRVNDMVGSGPFRFNAAERIPGARIVYDRFTEYQSRPDGEPSFTAGPKRVHFDRVEWHVLPDPATAVAALQSGEMDWWESPTFDLLPVMRRGRNVVVSQPDPTGYIGMLRMNHLQPPFDNPALRRAVVRAVSQDDYMTAVTGDERDARRTGVGFFCPGTPMASDAGMTALTSPRDLAQVRREVAASSYKGQPAVVLIPSDFPILKALSEVGADMLRQAGLNVDAQAADWGTILQRLAKTDPVEQGGWSVLHTYYSGLDQLNPAVNASLRGNGRAGGRGWPTSPELEKLRTDWLAAATDGDQRRIAAEMQLQAFQDVPYVPLGQIMAPTAHRRDIAGMLSGGYSLFWNVRRE